MIKSFRHKGVERFFRKGSRAGIQPKHAERLRWQLFALDNAKAVQDMNAPAWRLHALHGNLQGHWSVDVSGNWRLTFAFEGENAVLRHREVMGATDPSKAADGTIRKLHAKSIGENSVHGSDAAETATIEIAQFFSGNEIVG